MTSRESTRIGEHREARPIAGIVAKALKIFGKPGARLGELASVTSNDRSSEECGGGLPESAGLNRLAESLDPAVSVGDDIHDNPASAQQGALFDAGQGPVETLMERDRGREAEYIAGIRSGWHGAHLMWISPDSYPQARRH